MTEEGGSARAWRRRGKNEGSKRCREVGGRNRGEERKGEAGRGGDKMRTLELGGYMWCLVRPPFPHAATGTVSNVLGRQNKKNIS